MSTLLGIDVGGTTVKFGLVDCQGAVRVLDKDSIDTRPQDEPGVFADRVAEKAREMIARSTGKVSGIGIGCPGLVDDRHGIIRDVTNLPKLRDYPLCGELSRRVNLPAAIQNDANAAALGEFILVESEGVQNLVVITLGTGVGGGVVCHGRLLTGADNYAAELGHVKVAFENAAPCGCKRRGCLEAYAGIAGIARITMDEMLAAGGRTQLKVDDLSTRRITSAAEAGDAVAVRALHRVGGYLGRGLALFIDIFNPEQIVLGGGASAALDWLRPGIDQALFEFSTFEITRQRCVIRRSDRPGEINLIGAAATFLKAQS